MGDDLIVNVTRKRLVYELENFENIADERNFNVYASKSFLGTLTITVVSFVDQFCRDKKIHYCDPFFKIFVNSDLVYTSDIHKEVYAVSFDESYTTNDISKLDKIKFEVWDNQEPHKLLLTWILPVGDLLVTQSYRDYDKNLESKIYVETKWKDRD